MHNNEGFTLIELLSVIVILGIILSIAVPITFNMINSAEKDICHANLRITEMSYDVYKLGMNHSEALFEQFLLDQVDEICPSHGEISYEEAGFKCSVHGDEKEDSDLPGNEVPWL